MKRVTLLGLVTIAATVGLAGARAQTATVRLAVKAFDNPTTTSNVGNAVADILSTELGKTGRFQLVERAAFEEIAREIDFGQSDWAKTGTFATRGGALGADFIVMGKVSNLSFDEVAVTQQVRTARGVSQQVVYQQNAHARLDFRVVSARTGVAVITEAGENQQSRVSAVSEMSTWRRFQQTGVLSVEGQSSLYGRATVGAIQNAARKVLDLSRELERNLSSGAAANLSGLSGRIVARTGDAFIVSLGSNHGLVKGDRLTVFVEQTTRNASGAVVFREDRAVGVLDVTDLNPTSAKAQLVAGSAAATGRRPIENDVVRVDVDRASNLRGPTRVSGGTSGSGGSGSEMTRLVRDGDRYREDKYYAQAIDQYRKALALEPDSEAVMDKLVESLLLNKELRDAEDLIGRMMTVHGRVWVGVVHNHTIGACTGKLTISTKGLSYTPERGDHSFSVAATQLNGLALSTVGSSKLPALAARVMNERGREQRYDFVIPGYMTCSAGAFSVSGACKGDESALEDTRRLYRMLVRLVEDHVK